MAKQQKCLIARCPRIICPRCHHWYNPRKPDELKTHSKCDERPAPNRTLLPTCPQCRGSMYGYWGDATWAEIDERHQFVRMLDDRFVYRSQHPKRKAPRKQKQVRTTRATNVAPTTRSS